MERLTTQEIRQMNKTDLVDLLNDTVGEAKDSLKKYSRGELLAMAIRVKQTW